MPRQLTAEHEKIIERIVATGQYTDADQVITEALQQMDARERQQQELRTKLQIGIDELDRGEGVEWTPELMERLSREADEMFRRGEKAQSRCLPVGCASTLPRARRTISEASASYSLEQWGDERATDYISALNRAFQTLRDNPHLGAAKDGLYPGLRAFPVERHILYYRIKGDLIEIVRVLHARQDAAAAFRAEPPL